MSTPPVFSIIIPTYNHGHFLKKCLQSVVDQTFTDWEAIVVNNFSEDNTVDVVQSFQDPRIRLVNFRNNGIIASSRNKGIQIAKGDYIAFLDSDDAWYPYKLQRCIKALTQKRDLVCHHLRQVRNGTFFKQVKCGPKRKATFHGLLYNGSCLTTSAVVVRKDCLERVDGFSEDPEMVTSEDYDLWIKLAKNDVSFHFIDAVLGEYGIHESNASKRAIRHLKSTLTVVEKHYTAKESVNFKDRLLFRRARALLFYGAARSFQQSGDKPSAVRFYTKSMLMFPFILRIYAGIVFTFLSKKNDNLTA